MRGSQEEYCGFWLIVGMTPETGWKLCDFAYALSFSTWEHRNDEIFLLETFGKVYRTT